MVFSKRRNRPPKSNKLESIFKKPNFFGSRTPAGCGAFRWKALCSSPTGNTSRRGQSEGPGRPVASGRRRVRRSIAGGHQHSKQGNPLGGNALDDGGLAIA